MPVLSTLRQDRAGEWTSLDDYLRELRHRETSALGALANVLSAPAHEQKELAEHGSAGAVLLEVACDLRVPKGARLAATRCLLEAGIEAPFVGHLFAGAGDLVTDPRLGGGARKLVESGLPAALELGDDTSRITLAAGSFARAVHAAASAVGQARVRDLLAGAPELHAGAIAGRFALGIAELPENQRTGWQRLLEQTCAAHRRAPAAAKRLGLAPAWPPNLPDAFAAIVREAEQQAEGVEAADAVKSRPVSPAPPAPPAAKAPEKAPASAGGKTLAPPIRRSAFRRPLGTVVEVPTVAPPKPMEPLASQAIATGAPPSPAPARPRVETKEERDRKSPLPVPPLPPRGGDELRFDSRGKRIPRPDRWSDDAFEWETPVLPSAELPPPPRVGLAPGPFAQRLRSVLDDLPDAVERLCAAAEARASVAGQEAVARELSLELSRGVWRGKTLPHEQAQRLRAVAREPSHPAAWRVAAEALLNFLVPAEP